MCIKDLRLSQNSQRQSVLKAEAMEGLGFSGRFSLQMQWNWVAKAPDLLGSAEHAVPWYHGIEALGQIICVAASINSLGT